MRIGITAAYAGGCPQITVNSWTSAGAGRVQPAGLAQPDHRHLPGQQPLYTYRCPASAFVAGTNTMTITVISGSAR